MPTPPRWADSLLAWFCHPQYLEALQGDLWELFYHRAGSSPRAARRRYAWGVLRAFRPSLWKWGHSSTHNNNMSMLRSYLTTGWRALLRNRTQTALNIFGLALGLACALFVYVYVQDERATDAFHGDMSQVYRLNKTFTNPDGSVDHVAESSGAFGPHFFDNDARVVDYTRYTFERGETFYYELDGEPVRASSPNIMAADSGFFKIFKGFELLRGQPATVLNKPNQVVLTQQLAGRLFPEGVDPMGKTLELLESNLQFTVSGIVKAPPTQSSLEFDALVSWSTYTTPENAETYSFYSNWRAQALGTYFVLQPGTDPASFEPLFAEKVAEHIPDRAESYHFYLQPYSETYLGSDHVRWARNKQGSLSTLRVFGVIGLFVLLIACINYINIATSRATRRAREVGVRKAIGALRRQLITQFLSESFIVVGLSLALGYGLFMLLLPTFQAFTGKTIVGEFWLRADLAALLASGLLGLTFVSGLYPAFVLAAFKPVDVLSASSKSKLSGHWPRYILTGVQFTVSVSLIAATFVVLQQNNFMLNKSLGFVADGIIQVPLSPNVRQRSDAFRQQLLSKPNIKQVSLSNAVPGTGTWSTYVVPEGHTPENDLEVRAFAADANTREVYGMQLVAGRYFTAGSSVDSNQHIVVNQALVNALGWENPLGRYLDFDDETQMTIIGVIADFHMRSLHTAIEPTVFYMSPNARFATVMLEPAQLQEGLSDVQAVWGQFENKMPFDYSFVDEKFASFYEQEQRLMRIVIIFSAISILLSVLGLYGLTSYTIEARTKEIGIRKVLGASTLHIAYKLNKGFLILLGICTVIAIPVVLYALSSWLQGFAYHIQLGPWPFVLAAVATLAVVLASISGQVLRATRLNPADTLRYE